MKKTIIIAGASCGWGHMQAAHNVARALSSVQADWYVASINVFDYLPRGLKLLYQDGWRLASYHLDWLYDKFYHQAVSKTGSRHLVERLVQATAQRISADFEQSEVSVYIATHSVAAAVGSILKKRFKFKLCVVATDFVLHSMQIFPNVDFFYLPPGCHIPDQLKNRGNFEEKTQVMGIPIAPEFAMRKDKKALRKRLGLSTELTTVLFSFGGSGLRAERHIELFDDLLKLGIPLQFVVLAGQNAQFARVMRSRYSHTVRVVVHDYLEDVSDFYAVADVFMGKAGGLTISEALAASLPIIIIDALPGQETFNIEVLSSNNLGQHITNPAEHIGLVKSFLLDKMIISQKNNLETFARPHSSVNVARHIAGLAI